MDDSREKGGWELLLWGYYTHIHTPKTCDLPKTCDHHQSFHLLNTGSLVCLCSDLTQLGWCGHLVRELHPDVPPPRRCLKHVHVKGDTKADPGHAGGAASPH